MAPLNWLPLIDGMLEAVWLVDPIDLHIVVANQAAETLIGLPRGALAGKPVIDLAVTPEDVFFWEDVAAGLTDHIFSETLLLHQDGTSIQVERRVSHVQFDQDNPLYIVSIRDKSEQRRVENELENLIAELRATLESTADGILVVDMEGAIRSYNYRFSELWSLPEDLLTRRDDGAVYAWMKQSMLNSDHYVERLGVINRSPLIEATDILVLHSGRVLERVTLPQYARGRPTGRVYSYRDITQRLADEARLQLAAKVFESSLDAVFVTDADCRIIAANPSCERLTGHTQSEVLGLQPGNLFYDLGSDTLAEKMSERLNQKGVWEGEVWHRHKDGRTFPCLVSMVRLLDESGHTLHHIGFFKDMTESLAAKKKIEELAYNDTLTGLPNRLMLVERMALALSYAKRNGESFAVLFLDLDHFKQINDSLGHMSGDRVLVEVAERLRNCLRQVDMASRLGGDEFVLLLNQTDARGAEITARRVLEELAKPLRLDDITFTVTCSVGIALYPEDGVTIDDLVKNSDSAMYHVKERGRSDFRFYQRQMNIDLLSRMKLDHAMRLALEHGDFKLHYQPQVDLANGRIFGAEALIRWHDKDLGQISPAQFIPVAEETGVIVAIGNWVLTQAVQQAALWHAQGRKLVMAVNVSALQFQQANFVASVAEALQAAALPAEKLELELTESILLRDADDALKRLEALAELGVKLAIDDFGTGYSSLSYLKRFPIHKLKIDRSFICGLPDDDSDVAIAHAIINLAQALRLQVIAEGVETEAQREFLAAAGCQEYQGFLCSAAVGAEAFEGLVTAQEA